MDSYNQAPSISGNLPCVHRLSRICTGLCGLFHNGIIYVIVYLYVLRLLLTSSFLDILFFRNFSKVTSNPYMRYQNQNSQSYTLQLESFSQPSALATKTTILSPS